MSRAPSSDLQFLPLQPAIWERTKNGLRSEELITASSVVSVADHDYVRIGTARLFPGTTDRSCPCPPAAAQPPKPVSTGGLSSHRAETNEGSSGRNRLTPMRVHSYLHLARQRISDCIWLCSETLCRSASDSGPCSHAARLPPALDSCAGIDQFGAKYGVRQFVTGVKFDR